MHKAFRAIEREKGEDGRAFFARVFKEAGGSGDFHEPWMQMSQVVDEGYESPYVFGRNNVPSLSELVSRIATAYQHDPDQTAAAIGIILLIAAEAEQRDPMTRDDDGRPFTLADTRNANPAEFWKFATLEQREKAGEPGKEG